MHSVSRILTQIVIYKFSESSRSCAILVTIKLWLLLGLLAFFPIYTYVILHNQYFAANLKKKVNLFARRSAFVMLLISMKLWEKTSA